MVVHMPLRRHVCRLSFYLKAPKDHVWISEEVLNNAINHPQPGITFRRHVGVVPGPLEARKRAAKRRMVNLAQVGGAGEIDPSLFGGPEYAPGRNGWQWQNPTTPATKDVEGVVLRPCSIAHRSANICTEPSSLPRWLTDFENLAAIEDPPKDEEDDTLRRSQYSNFLKDMEACRNLRDLHEWARTRASNLRQYSRLAFRHLTDTGSPIPILLEALEDTALRTLGNLNYFLARRLAQPLSQTDTNLLGHWLRRHVSVGVWPDNEVLTLIESASDTVGPAKDEQLKCKIIESLFEGLQSSTVLKIQDADYKIPRSLLTALHQGSITWRSQHLATRIIKALQPVQLEKLAPTISTFIINCIRAKASLHYHDKQGLKELQAVPGAIEILRCLPRNVANLGIMSTSTALIRASGTPDPTISRTAMLKLLADWWSSLARFGTFSSTGYDTPRRKIERILAGERLEIIAPYLRHLREIDIVDFVLQQWLEQRSYFAALKQIRHLSNQVDQIKEFESPFVIMLRVMKHRAVVSDDNLKRLFRLLQALKMSNTIVDIILRSNDIGIHISENAVLHTIRTHMNVCPEMAQRIFCAYPGSALESCPDFAEILIANPQIHPGIPYYYYISRRPEPKAATCREPVLAIRRRAALLKRMASAYSGALHLSPRMAFDKVYACYKCHMGESLGPISREMVLAFTHAGIIRPLQRGTWVSTVKLRWILALTRKVESAEIADEVDSLVYRWRGAIVRKIQERQIQDRRRITSRPLSDSWDVPVLTEFSWRWRRYIKRLSFTTDNL